MEVGGLELLLPIAPHSGNTTSVPGAGGVWATAGYSIAPLPSFSPSLDIPSLYFFLFVLYSLYHNKTIYIEPYITGTWAPEASPLELPH